MKAYEFAKITIEAMEEICVFCEKKIEYHQARTTNAERNFAKVIVYQQVIEALEQKKPLPWEDSNKVFLKEVYPRLISGKK